MKKSYKYCEFCNQRVKSKYKHYQENVECALANERKIKEDEKLLDNWNKEKTIKCKICDYKSKELTRHLKTEHQLTPKEYKEKYGEIISEYEKLKKSIFWRKKNAGTNNPMYNKKPWNTDITRKEERVEKLGSTWRGKTFSNEHRNRLAISKVGLTGKEANAYGPHNISEEGRKRMREGSLKGKETINRHSQGEIEIGIYLHDLFEDTIWNYSIDFYQCDYCIPSKKLIVEYDGDWYHAGTHFGENEVKSKTQKRVFENDEQKTETILSQGYKLVRILESEFHRHKEKGDVKRWLKDLLK